MGKMGAANRVTEKRYNAIKAEAKSPKDDKKLGDKYGVGKATMIKIRNTDNFYEYRSKSTTGRARREHLQSTLAELEEKPAVLDSVKLDYEEIQNRAVKPLVLTIVALVMLMSFLAIGTIILTLGGKK